MLSSFSSIVSSGTNSPYGKTNPEPFSAQGADPVIGEVDARFSHRT
ncbi:hypothetical protein [Streptomyces sp. NPDC019507]